MMSTAQLIILLAQVAFGLVLGGLVLAVLRKRREEVGRYPADAYGALLCVDAGPVCLWHEHPIEGIVSTTRGGGLRALDLAPGQAADRETASFHDPDSDAARAYRAIREGAQLARHVQAYQTDRGEVHLDTMLIRDESGGNWGICWDVSAFVRRAERAETEAAGLRARVERLSETNETLRAAGIAERRAGIRQTIEADAPEADTPADDTGDIEGAHV